MKYHRGIDGLRGVSVLLVVFYHAGGLIPHGLVGVDAFFAISGFLITSILSEEVERHSRVDFPDFYLRRMKRLLPALLLVVLTVVVVTTLIRSGSTRFPETARSAAAALLFVSNLFFYRTEADYFSDDVTSYPLLNLWSLGVEEQFYLLWPIVIVAIARLSGRNRILVLAALSALSLLYAEFYVRYDSAMSFYSPLSRAWELGIGALAACLHSCRPRRLQLNLGVALICGSAFYTPAHFPGLSALPSVLGSALVLHSLCFRANEGAFASLLNAEPVVWFGRISYSLYLWHWPVIVLVPHVIGVERSLPVDLVSVFISIVLAAITYRWVEQPVRNVGTIQRKKRAVSAGVLLIVAISMLLLSLARYGEAMRPPDTPAAIAARDFPGERFACHYRGDQEVTDVPRAGCPRISAPGTATAIWGDSHALAWYPFAKRLASKDGEAAEMQTRDSCPPVPEFANGRGLRQERACMAFNEKVLAHFHETPPRRLIVAARWMGYEADGDAWTLLERVIRDMAPRVEQVIIIGPSPTMPLPVPECLERDMLDRCTVSRGQFAVSARSRAHALEQIANEHGNVVYLDPLTFLCNERDCPGVRDDIALYWDGDHVSERAASAAADAYLSGKGSGR